MKLADLEQEKREEGVTLYWADIPTEGGPDHRLEILGTPKLVTRALKEAEFDLRVVSGGTEEQWSEYVVERSSEIGEGDSPSEPGALTDYFKKAPPAPGPANSMVTSVRPLGRTRTWWYLSVSGAYVLRGSNHWYTLPAVHSTTGLLIPASGDPDLYLYLNGTSWLVAQSLAWNLQWDSVHHHAPPFWWPWKVFKPYYRVYGYKASHYGFGCSGFRL